MKDMRVGEKWDVDSMCTYLFHELRTTRLPLPLVGIDDIFALVEARAGATDESASEHIAPTIEAVDGSARR